VLKEGIVFRGEHLPLEVEKRRNPIGIVAVEAPGQANEHLKATLTGNRRNGAGAGQRDARR